MWPSNPAAAAKSLQSCPTLCDPIDGSPPGSPVPGILQARRVEWVAISFSNAWKWKVKVKSLSPVQHSDPMDCSPPGSSIHWIFQARVLEWGAIAFSDPAILLLGKYKKKMNTNLKRYMNLNVYYNHIYNRKDMEATSEQDTHGSCLLSTRMG